jgi:hypothetical protein
MSTSAVTSGERRLVYRMMSAWDRSRHMGTYPRPERFSADILGDDWRDCFLLVLETPRAGSRLRHAGDRLHRGYPRPLLLSSVRRHTLLGAALASLDEVLARSIPVSRGGQIDTGTSRLLYRAVLMPVATDGERIDHVLGAVNGRETERGLKA